MPSAATGHEDFGVELTPPQREAAGWEEGPLLLMAGPGSGKTRVLTYRIARLLNRSEDENWRIAALTFTRAAADQMRSRVDELCPSATSRAFIGTFHSFAAELLRQAGTSVGVATDFRVYANNPDRRVFLIEAMTNLGLEEPYQLDPILGAIDRFRDSLIVPTLAPKNGVGETSSISQIAREYDEVLTRNGGLDFQGILHKAYQLITQSPSILQRFRRVYRYLCIDEFQDTNATQYAFLREFLGRDFRNVFAVADDDQLIYGWNGASPSRLREFFAEFAPRVMQLPTNFRCPGEVVTLANNLLRHNATRFEGKVPVSAWKKASVDLTRVRVLEFVDDGLEAVGIADNILQVHGQSPEDVAVIARTKGVLDRIQTALKGAGLNVHLAQRRDAFASLPFRWLQAALQLANRRADQTSLGSFVDLSNALLPSEMTADFVIAQADATHGDYLRAWSAFAAAGEPGQLARVLLDACGKSLAELQDYRGFLAKVTAEYVSGADALSDLYASFDDDLRAWTPLLHEIENAIGREAGLDEFLRELSMRSKEPPPKPHSVRLLTIHGSKGMEFPHVYLVGLAEDLLPSFQSKKRSEFGAEMEEERRNCFVAITRCIETLTLSYAHRYNGFPKAPSRFLGEMGLPGFVAE